MVFTCFHFSPPKCPPSRSTQVHLDLQTDFDFCLTYVLDAPLDTAGHTQWPNHRAGCPEGESLDVSCRAFDPPFEKHRHHSYLCEESVLFQHLFSMFFFVPLSWLSSFFSTGLTHWLLGCPHCKVDVLCARTCSVRSLLVAMPFATSSVLTPSSKARSP